MDSKKQINFIHIIMIIMGIIPLVDSCDKKSLSRSLQRHNQNLNTQFDDLFSIIDKNKETLQKLILPKRIPKLIKDIQKFLPYNGLDLMVKAPNDADFFYYSVICAGLFIESNYLYSHYSKLKISPPLNNPILDFLSNNTKKLFEWFTKETPFKNINEFSENCFKKNPIDNKTIYNWQKGDHAISSKVLLEIREHLETLAKMENIENAQSHIDFFIYAWYIEACKIRLRKRFIKIFNIDDEFLKLFKTLISVIRSCDLKMCSLQLDNETYQAGIESFTKMHEIIQSKLKENPDEYLKHFSEKDKKYPKYRIQKETISEKSLQITNTVIENYDELTNYLNADFLLNMFLDSDNNNMLNLFLEQILSKFATAIGINDDIFTADILSSVSSQIDERKKGNSTSSNNNSEK